jgi:hypothetical protein
MLFSTEKFAVVGDKKPWVHGIHRSAPNMLYAK